MQKHQQPCSFFLLRYVPSAVRAEFVNIGLVLTPPIGPPEVRLTSDWSRVRGLDPQADVEMLQTVADDLRGRMAGTGAQSQTLFRMIEDSFSGALQISGPKACLADSPAQEADRLAQLYLESARRPQSRERSARQAILRRMKEEFDAYGVWRGMNRNIAVAEYARNQDPLKIDCGYKVNSQPLIKMFHAAALAGDANIAKVLAFSYPALVEGIRKKENAEVQLTAVVEDGLQHSDSAVHFAFETLERYAIKVVPVSMMPDVASQTARDLGVG